MVNQAYHQPVVIDLVEENSVSTVSPCVLEYLCFLKDLVSILPNTVTFEGLVNIKRIIIKAGI